MDSAPRQADLDPAGFRVAYQSGTLEEAGMRETPLAQFGDWWRDAVASGMPEPNAMALATVGADGRPAARTVLLKGFDAEGFRFFTHLGSRKARAMAARPGVSLLFAWIALQRQVEVAGMAERICAAESAAYFRTRPRDSQLAAWVSAQSEPIAGRDVLDRAMEEARRRWPEGADVPMPEGWGGFLVRPESVEFWQGRPSRLHDRLRFEALVPGASLADAAAWRVRRYAP